MYFFQMNRRRAQVFTTSKIMSTPAKVLLRTLSSQSNDIKLDEIM